MERYLAGLCDLTRRRRRLVVAVWAALVLSGARFAAHQFHYIYGFRGAANEARARQRKVETYAERTKELV